MDVIYDEIIVSHLCFELFKWIENEDRHQLKIASRALSLPHPFFIYTHSIVDAMKIYCVTKHRIGKKIW